VSGGHEFGTDVGGWESEGSPARRWVRRPARWGDGSGRGCVPGEEREGEVQWTGLFLAHRGLRPATPVPSHVDRVKVKPWSTKMVCRFNHLLRRARSTPVSIKLAQRREKSLLCLRGLPEPRNYIPFYILF
jgi:hypothetical protein